MQEFATVSASSYDPAALAAKLTEKSAEGWAVVGIVATGGDVTAFLSRNSGTTAAHVATVAETAHAPEQQSPMPVAAPVSEPAGWAVAPEPAAAPMAPITTAAPATSVQPAPSYQPAPAATPAVPAGWYADPAGRFELRYWDGGSWTEHVSRSGQQFTDPPVA